VKGSGSFVKYQLPALVWCVAIFGFSAIPGIGIIRIPLRVDKLIHGSIYFILCLLVWRAFFYQVRYPRVQRRAILWAFFFSCLYGIIDESHQVLVPGRTPDVYDAVADGTGALVFVLFYWWVLRRRVQPSNAATFDKK